MNVLRKALEGSSKIPHGALEMPDGTLTEAGRPTLEYLTKSHFPVGETLKNTEYNNNNIIMFDTINNTEMNWITPDLLQSVFRLFK